MARFQTSEPTPIETHRKEVQLVLIPAPHISSESLQRERLQCRTSGEREFSNDRLPSLVGQPRSAPRGHPQATWGLAWPARCSSSMLGAIR